jgi:hypothetical protein
VTTTTPGVAFRIEETVARLRDSLATLEWAAAMIPGRWTHTLRESYPPDAWSAAMNLAHLVVYEEQVAAPVLEALAAGGDGASATRSAMESWFLKDAEAIAGEPVPALLQRLRSARARQIATIESFDEARFNTPVCALWGASHSGPLRPAGWIAAKTFQHTWEHGNAILRVALFAGPA